MRLPLGQLATPPLSRPPPAWTLWTAAALLSLNPEVKIVVATGLDSPSRGQAAVPAGCRAALKKPYVTSRLLQTMHLILQGERPSPKQAL